MRWIFLGLLLAAPPVGADTWAVIVGVEEYEDGEITPLQYAVRDARAVSERLQACGLDRRTITLLTSDAVEPTFRPTRGNVLRGISNVADRAGADDTFLFFFAGHGLQRGEHQPPLLLTVDTNRRLPDQTALALEDLEAALGTLPCRRLILFLDACRNNPDSGRAETDNAMGRDLARNLRPRQTTGPQRVQEAATVFACDVGQRAWEMGSEQHGAFTYFLLEALSGAAAGDDQMVTVGETVDYIRGRLRSWCAQRAKPAQEPMLVGVAAHWPLVRAAAPAGVSLKLDSSPPGAKVYLDATDTGRITPCEVQVPFDGDVASQTVWIEFRRIGYRAKRLEVTVDRRRGAEVPTVTLERVQPVIEDPLEPVPVVFNPGPVVEVPTALRDEATAERHLKALAGALRAWSAAHGGRLPPSLRWPETLAEYLPDDLLDLLRDEAPSYAYSGPAAGGRPTPGDPRFRVLCFESDAPGPAAVAHPALVALNRRGDRTHRLVAGDFTVQRVTYHASELDGRRREAEPHRWLSELGARLWQLGLSSGYPDGRRWTVELIDAGLWPGVLPDLVRQHTLYYHAALAGHSPLTLENLDRTVLAWLARGERPGFEAADRAGPLGIEGRDEYLVLTAAGWTTRVGRAQLAAMLGERLPDQPAGPPLFDRSRANLVRIYGALYLINSALGRLPAGDRWQDMVEAERVEAEAFSLPGHEHCYALNPWVAGRPAPGDPEQILVFESALARRNVSGEAQQAVPKPGWHHGKVAVLFADGRVALLPPDELASRLRSGGVGPE